MITSSLRLNQALVIAALSAVALAACGSSSGSSSGGSSSGGMSGHGGMNMGSTSMKGQLKLARASAGTGNATVSLVNNQIHVDLTAQQLSTSTAYGSHLHQGTCTAAGAVLKDMGSFTTDAAGNGKAHAEFDGQALPDTAFVDIHTNQGGASPDLCGDLAAS